MCPPVAFSRPPLNILSVNCCLFRITSLSELGEVKAPLSRSVVERESKELDRPARTTLDVIHSAVEWRWGSRGGIASVCCASRLSVSDGMSQSRELYRPWSAVTW